MRITADTTLADIATQIPASMEVFERFNIDFCCGGDQPLEEAARAKGLSAGDLISEIERAVENHEKEDEIHEDWSRYSPSGLLDHIVEAHHEYLRKELPATGAKLAKVIQVHGDRHHELFDLGRVFERLRDELEQHLALEENQIFPAIRKAFPDEEELGLATPVSEDARTGESGTLVDWLEDLESDHGMVGQLLRRMREITDDYTVPQDACATYSALYRSLLELENDIHRHVHLENNILMPALKDALQRTPH